MSHNINYVLDPQYTSVMNDIKIMSRGGAKLSEILPNYILKEVVRIHRTKDGSDVHCYVNGNYQNFCDIPKPECPDSYTPAVTVQPIQWKVGFGAAVGGSPKTHLRIIDPTTSPTLEAYPTGYASEAQHDSYHEANEVTIGEGVCVAIQEGTGSPSSSDMATALALENDSSESTWRVFLGYKNNASLIVNCSDDAIPTNWGIQALVYLYCVYREDDSIIDTSINSQSDCEAKGWTWKKNSSNVYKCYKILKDKERENLTADDCAKITKQGTCNLVGCTWTGDDTTGTCGLASP